MSWRDVLAETREMFFFYLEFCPKENVFLSEGKWNFFRTKRSFFSDKILALPNAEGIEPLRGFGRHSPLLVNNGYRIAFRLLIPLPCRYYEEATMPVIGGELYLLLYRNNAWCGRLGIAVVGNHDACDRL